LVSVLLRPQIRHTSASFHAIRGLAKNTHKNSGLTGILDAMDWIVSLTPEVAPDPLLTIASPPEKASIVELRLDRFPGIDVAAAVGACPLPLLATLRSQAEGGDGPTDPDLRSATLTTAREAGAALIDLEFERDASLADTLGLAPEQKVVSWHNPSETPANLEEIAGKMLAFSARWVKLVPFARRLEDLVRVLELHARFNTGRRHERRLLAFAMGGTGLASRHLAQILGPPLGFAAWSEDAPAAPGQISIEATEAVIGHLEGPPQRLYGVVGADVSSSLSPALHAAGYRGLGLPYLLLPISVPDADELNELFGPRGSTPFDRIGLEVCGWAVTTPYKAHAAAAADFHAPRVLRAGAANTLILGEHQVIAENTDADGVVGSLVSAGIDPNGELAIVQGTGGAARGVAVGLHLAGADVVIRGRSADRTQSTAEAIETGWCKPEEDAPEGALLVNATPVGRDPEEVGPFSNAEISGAGAVVDMVYASHTTGLISRARDLGVPTVDGREVLLHQGVAQFAAFTQRVPPKEPMRDALRRK
jgi:3-dehydroquinate dehydratase/shikimate dehydrogenase